MLKEQSREEIAGKIVRRLRVADGHLQGIMRMVESGAECHAVLNQLIAVKSSLEKTALYLLACYGQEAITQVAETGKEGKPGDAAARFSKEQEGEGGMGGDGDVRAVLDEVLAMAAKLLS